MARGEDGTTKLLQQVVQQLTLQTEELKHIRRSSSTTNQILSAIHQLVQQLLHMLHAISDACSALAAAANSYLDSLASAQRAARLHATLCSGRLLMLLAMAVLALLNTRAALGRQCMQGAPASLWALAAHKASAVLGLGLGRRQQQAQAGMLWALAAPAKSGRCVLAFAGRYSVGASMLLLWTCWAWRRQQHCNSLSTCAAAGGSPSTHPAEGLLAALPSCDPITTLLLAAAPTSSRSISSSDASSWAIVLQAALYEALLGGVTLKLLGGRVWLWMLLWEVWLAWVSNSLLSQSRSHHTPSTTTSSSSSTCGAAGAVQPDTGAARQRPGSKPGGGSKSQPTQVFWVDRLPVRVAAAAAGTAKASPEGSGAAAVAASAGHRHTSSSSSKSGGGVVGVLLQRAGLALLHLGLPLVLAAAALWL